MKNGKPNHGSGKTHFNRIKAKGQSWTALRQAAIQNGTFRMPVHTEKEKAHV